MSETKPDFEEPIRKIENLIGEIGFGHLKSDFAKFRIMQREALQSAYNSGKAENETVIAKMQSAMRNYLQPIAYERHTPGGTCKADSVVEMPAHNHANDQKRKIAHERNEMFINDIIYFLDSEEYGTNVARLIDLPNEVK